MSPDWIPRFPELTKLTPAEQTLIAERAQVVSLPAQTTVFAPGLPAENFLLLLDGTVRVQQVSSGGREIVLYRVSSGESCIMTTACLLSQDTYNAEGVTETPVQAVAVPRATFDEMMARSAEFRRFVFADYSSRITDLLHVVEEVAFERIDKRLAQKLAELADGEGRLTLTHQELAVELGTAREVISRHLKEFQRRDWLTLTRGHIQLSDRAALARLAAGD
ncbi:Crp/Fnr family transcriptional regulator [Pelagibius litoralis]|uniref:Crp/Fnr family transcriptional regulator n=1 Tax=Pelagibius litoralis TaxID=374515 RepID=A0A967EXH7_9PROT|nr:Crp/Fnr family transcriptional regulator [Pelagibius litoralis]NIA69217.1 Crp/Fnr family transcriptional regulator [Pelagibius litoralis]